MSKRKQQNRVEATETMRFDIYKWKANEWRWRLVDAKGLIVASSYNSYDSFEACESAIIGMKKGIFPDWKINDTCLEDDNAD